jgi:hypothetical protein
MPRPNASRRALAALLAIGALLAAAAPAHAARDLEVSIMDDQLLLGNSRTNVDASMTIFRDLLGVDRVRVSAFWNQIAPRPTSRRKPSGFNGADHTAAGYNWSHLDAVVASAAEHGLKVMISISSPFPYWASEQPSRRNNVWRPKPAEYASFAFAVAARYSAFVDHFGIYNEPNQGAWLQPQSDRRGSVSPHLYRELVRAAYPVVKAAAPDSTVLVGELAPSGRDDRGATRPIRPLKFLREMGCVNSRFRNVRSGRCRGFRPVPADAIGHHPYQLFRSPRSRSPRRDDAAIGDWRRLLRTLDGLTRKRAVRPSSGSRLDVYYTEFGYQTDPPDPFAGIPVSRQDRWLQDAAFTAWRTPRVRAINQFRLTDGAVGRGTDAFNEFQSGLLFRNQRPKPAFGSFAHPLVPSTTRPRRGRSVSLWGQARPGARHQVSIEYRSGSRGAFREVAEVRTDARGYFRKSVRARTGQYRYRYTDGTVSGTSRTVTLRTR